MRYKRTVRKGIAVFLTIALCFGAVGCGKVMNAIQGIFPRDERYEDIRYGIHYSTMMEKIISALDAHDVSALKQLFSDDTVQRTESFDEKLEEFIGFYEGESVSYESTGGVEAGDMITYYVEKDYTVKTDAGSYCITFSYTSREQNDGYGKRDTVSRNIGINGILIMTKELADEAQFTQWPPDDGIFILRSLDECTIPEN